MIKIANSVALLFARLLSGVLADGSPLGHAADKFCLYALDQKLGREEKGLIAKMAKNCSSGYCRFRN